MNKRTELVNKIKELELTPEQREYCAFKGYGVITAKGTALEDFSWSDARLNLMQVAYLEKLYRGLCNEA